ncbi:MAG TPA: ABC transporter ATP-binding protein [Verrucomicrobiota bacterium]|nr:ABC transporter [Verrucomicrobiales bacterium]HRI15210.1 ABC transporter ATP-binding protein [Verrucomicrobiota bacterium]
MSDLAIRAAGLTKSYALGRRRLEVLRGVNLDVPRGDFVALRGSSGAGKSTLLHLLGGLDRPGAGEVILADQVLATLSDSALTSFRNRHVGFIFQFYHLLPELDVVENVVLPARMARVPVAAATARATQLLRRVGLGDRLDHLPLELSGGEQQRVALARCLINEPELILADEPTGNLDSKTGAEVLELLLELRAERGTTLVIATHSPAVAARAARVVDMVDGRLVEPEKAA